MREKCAELNESINLVVLRKIPSTGVDFLIFPLPPFSISVKSFGQWQPLLVPLVATNCNSSGSCDAIWHELDIKATRVWSSSRRPRGQNEFPILASLKLEVENRACGLMSRHKCHFILSLSLSGLGVAHFLRVFGYFGVQLELHKGNFCKRREKTRARKGVKSQ